MDRIAAVWRDQDGAFIARCRREAAVDVQRLRATVIEDVEAHACAVCLVADAWRHDDHLLDTACTEAAEDVARLRATATVDDLVIDLRDPALDREFAR